jgi:hypothetical protein
VDFNDNVPESEFNWMDNLLDFVAKNENPQRQSNHQLHRKPHLHRWRPTLFQEPPETQLNQLHWPSWRIRIRRRQKMKVRTTQDIATSSTQENSSWRTRHRRRQRHRRLCLTLQTSVRLLCLKLTYLYKLRGSYP